MEKELADLQLQLRLAAGPKRQALDLLRGKIEVQNDKLVSVRARHVMARKVRPLCRGAVVGSAHAQSKLTDVGRSRADDLSTYMQQYAGT